MKTQFIPLIAGLMMLTGCASNGQGNHVDQGDGVDTPDVLLQDTDGKSVQYGVDEYGLATDAKKRNQQVKPDPLVSGVNNGSRANGSEPVQQRSEQTSTVRQPVKKPPVDKQKAQEKRLKKDSALEVEDSLLDEIDQD